MRRITTGVQGGPILGTFTAKENNLQTLEQNADIVLQPNGAGEIKLDAHMQINGARSLKFADADSSNYVSLQSPATVGSDITYTLPGGGISAGYVLSTDASGNLSWIQTIIDVADQVADSSTYYPTMTTSSSGSISGLAVSSSKLSFVPSTGVLSVTSLSAGSATVTGALQAQSITETSSIVLKDNITAINDALDKVLQLQGVNYTRKATGEYEAGLIAEEVEKVVPELVNNDHEYASVNYSRITAYLVEAVKSLAKQVDELTGK
jgi:hypothetical protein